MSAVKTTPEQASIDRGVALLGAVLALVDPLARRHGHRGADGGHPAAARHRRTQADALGGARPPPWTSSLRALPRPPTPCGRFYMALTVVEVFCDMRLVECSWAAWQMSWQVWSTYIRLTGLPSRQYHAPMQHSGPRVEAHGLLFAEHAIRDSRDGRYSLIGLFGNRNGDRSK